jgi:hypothetical protein
MDRLILQRNKGDYGKIPRFAGRFKSTRPSFPYIDNFLPIPLFFGIILTYHPFKNSLFST